MSDMCKTRMGTETKCTSTSWESRHQAWLTIVTYTGWTASGATSDMSSTSRTHGMVKQRKDSSIDGKGISTFQSEWVTDMVPERFAHLLPKNLSIKKTC
jgi:hypothetical protein